MMFGLLILPVLKIWSSRSIMPSFFLQMIMFSIFQNNNPLVSNIISRISGDNTETATWLKGCSCRSERWWKSNSSPLKLCSSLAAWTSLND